MDKNDILKLANHQGLFDYFDLEGDSVGQLMLYTLVLDCMAAEREACAKLVEDYLSVGLAKEMSRIIRERGNHANG